MQVLRRSAITVVGIALLAGGAALLVLPGPGILLIVAGLAVLATEYAWARRFLGGAKDKAEQAQRQAVASPWRTAATVLFGLAMLGVGITMIVVTDVRWPVWDDAVDRLWSPLAGGIVIVTSLILLTTTVLTVLAGRRGSD